MDACGNPVVERPWSRCRGPSLRRPCMHRDAHQRARASAEGQHARRIDLYRGKMGNFRICMLQGARVAPVLNTVDHRIRGSWPAANHLGQFGTPR